MNRQNIFGKTYIIISVILQLFLWGCNDEEVATLTTLPVLEITANSALSGGMISSDGGMAVTTRGVVWATHDNPTTLNTTVSGGRQRRTLPMSPGTDP